MAEKGTLTFPEVIELQLLCEEMQRVVRCGRSGNEEEQRLLSSGKVEEEQV